ncbi:MAG: glycosyltransferase [Endomicrobia bacterium]|nr:glycosyltransferase [Endomicrobiia bacterium]
MFKKFNPLAVIPLYNHSGTIEHIVSGSLPYCKEIMIVDDGSTDSGIRDMEKLPVNIIRFKKNKGKGAAIIAAAEWAAENKFTHIITIDADGQHYPYDIPKLLKAAEDSPNSIIIGKRKFENPDIPAASKFGRKFSGFWAKVQTGKKIIDMQSGYRVYPLSVFDKFKIYTRRFTFEVEIIIKALWAGFKVEEVEVDVHYPDKKKRISHFKFFADNARISILNTYLTIRAMIPFPHRKYIENKEGKIISQNPFKAVAEQMKNENNPFHLAVSAAWGSFWGALALPGVRAFILMVGVGWFNLNRAVAFSVDKLAMPPFIPFVCIEVGYYLRHGKFLTEISWQIIGTQFLQRVWEWILGSLIVAPVFALLVGSIVYIAGKIMRIGARKLL